ncbi:HDIG domain-containing protein [Schleiferiaceae bacterium]|nr:HDIG domain-containing protein [Schleiferiaceae bacterium]
MKASNWIQQQQKWVYFSIVSVLCIALLFVSIPFKAQFQYDYRLGQVWLEDDLIAPTDFALPKSPEKLEEDRQQLIAHKDLYYNYINQINNWRSNLDSTLIPEAEFIEWQRRGVVLSHPSDHHKVLLADGTPISLKNSLSPDYLRAKYALPDSVELVPTFTLNTALTDSALTAKINALTTFRGIITKGTPVVLRGATVTAEKFEMLKALEANFDGIAEDLNWQGRAGALLYLLLVFLGLALYLNAYDAQIIAHSSSLNLLLFSITGAGTATLWVSSISVLNVFLVPLVLLPVLVRSFFNDRLALITHVFLLLTVAPFISGAVHFIAVQFAAGLITLFNIRGIYKRSQLFQSTFKIMGILLIVHLSIHLIRQMEWTVEAAIPLGSSLIGTLVLLFIFPLIYFFERTFGVVSDLTLLELSDTNNPLLKRLSKEAPGTFQHTMQVANLAEHATELVGGNTLLVRTGALYHDIGKIPNAQYFTENQSSSASPHDELSYTESAKIIIGHISDGIELAKKHRLPDIVIDFIRTHHGTSRVEYFYRKYKEDHPDSEKFESFQYPGPKPFSKETAIVMMSDAVEASTRSLPEKSQEALSTMIDKVIDHQLTTGQLDNADITLKEINAIREAFKKFMRGVYHVRISYPEEVKTIQSAS